MTQLFRILFQATDVRHDLLGTRDNFHAFRRRYDGLSAAVEDTDAQLVFELLHHHAEGGLCYKALFGSPRKMPVHVDGNDVLKLLKIHIDNIYANIDTIS